MTLRLRRGTDLERQAITFQEGELVYITDTKDLYAGDGTTVGGIKVSNIGSPSSLTQNLNLNGYSIQGSGTISATSFIGDGSALTGIDIGVQSGQEYDIDIRGSVRSFDSTIIVDPITNNIYGNFWGDGSNLINVPGTFTPSADYTINVLGYIKTFNDEVIVDPSTKTLFGDFIGSHQGSLRADNSTLLVDAETSSFFGTFVGDGSLLSNIEINQLVDFNVFLPSEGDVLQYSAGSWVNGPLSGTGITEGSNYRINIIGDDSTTIVDSATGDVTGNFSGNLFTDTISYDEIITFTNTTPGLIGQVSLNNTGDAQYLKFTRTDAGTAPDQPIGVLSFEQEDDTGIVAYSSMGFWHSGIYIGHSTTGIFNTPNYIGIQDGGLSIGDFSPEVGYKLDVTGDSIFRGSGSFSLDVTAAAFKGSLVADDSTIIVDAINGTVIAQGFIQFGSYTDAQIAEITPSNGMVYYNTTDNRFRGYQNGGWINLDDGTSA